MCVKFSKIFSTSFFSFLDTIALISSVSDAISYRNFLKLSRNFLETFFNRHLAIA